MEQARWNQIEELLQSALDLEPNERATFLNQACGEDEALRREVEALLGKEVEAEQFIESPAVARPAEQEAGQSPALHTGQQIGHYRIEARIGAGGMGEVYQARDLNLQRVVALKVLPPEFTADPDRVRRFEQEAFAASRLNHPNIITIFGIIHADGTHFIATEHIEGETLRELLTDRKANKPRKLDVEKALEITIQIARGLKAAHTAWIIHRDIKPENIMVRSDGLVKVLDFGIAKLAEEEPKSESDVPNSGGGHMAENPPQGGPVDSVPNLTVAGAIMGTASYMSPEQAQGESLDGRTDLFSLGVVLYEMVTGERLFTGATRAELLQAMQDRHELVRQNVRLDQVPNDLQRIIRKMLRRNRHERCASAAELLDDLNRLKRRLENRTTRRMVALSALVVILAVTLAAIAAFLSVSEVWEERVLRDGHAAAARQAVFSPDGRLLLSCGEDGQVIVWDFARRERLATLTDHTAHQIAFSPNGRWFATGGTNGTILIWDAVRREKIRVLRGHQREIGALTFSPDGRLLASSSSAPLPDGRTILWDTGRWEKLREWPLGMSYGTFLFSPDLKQLMCSQNWTVFDVTKGQQMVTDPQRHANWAAFSPSMVSMSTVDPFGHVSFYRANEPGDLRKYELIARHRIHQDHGRSVAFSSDGRLVASGAEDIVLWDAARQQKIARLEHSAIVWSVAFSPDGRWLVSSHGDGAVLVWDVKERERVANLNEHSGAVRAVAIAPDGRRIASASEDRTVTVWDSKSARKQAVLEGHRTRVTAVAFSADGRWLGSGDQDGTVILWDTVRRQPRLTVKPADLVPPTFCLALSPDGRWLATTNGIYASADGHSVVDFLSLGKFHFIYGATFSLDGQRLACVTDDGRVLVWDVRSWQLLEQYHMPNTQLVSVSMSRDGKVLVTGEDQGAVRLWSVAPLRQIAVLGRHSARVKSVVFSPDGATVASAGDDKVIALWHVKRRKLLTRIGTHASPVYAVAFSPDGRQLVSGEHDRSVRVYTRHRTLWGFSLE